VLKKDSLVLIISDGFDTDEPELLNTALAKLEKKVKRIIWLSPVLERLGDQASTEIMQSALRYIDALLPAHSLVSLQQSLQVIKRYS